MSQLTTQRDHRSRQRQAQRRLHAVQRLTAGESVSKLARELGVHRVTLHQWLRRYTQQGEAGLGATPISGRKPLIDQQQLASLCQLLADTHPNRATVAAPLWSDDSVHQLLREQFDIELSNSAVKRLLQRLGLAPKRLTTLLTQRQSAVINDWLEKTLPPLQAQANRQRTPIFLLTINRCTPQSDHGDYYSVAAVSTRGKLYFCLHRKPVAAKQYQRFIQHLQTMCGGRCHLIIDNNPATQKVSATKSAQGFLNRQHNTRATYLPAAAQNDIPTTPVNTATNPKTGGKAAAQRTLDEWIGLLHQSLLDDQHPFTLFLTELCYALNSRITLVPDLDTPTIPIRPAYPDMNLEKFIDLNKQHLTRWHDIPFIQALKKPGDICILRDLLPRDQWPGNALGQHLIEENIEHVMALGFQGPGQSLCGLFVHRESGGRAFDRSTIALLQQLHPHLSTAMALAVRHWHHQFTVTALNEMSHHLDIATFILDGNANITSANYIANRLLENDSPLSRSNRRILFANKTHQAAFHGAVQKAIAWRQAPIGIKPIEALRFDDGGKHWLGILVQSITPPSLTMPHSVTLSPHVVVYINDPTRPRPNAQQRLIAQLFNLSNQEAHLTRLLINNHPLNDAARLMHITQATARTYLQHIYEKVGVRRRDELVKQVLKSVALLA